MACGACSYAWGGWFACVGAYMCGHGVGVIMWQMVAVGVCVCCGVFVYVVCVCSCGVGGGGGVETIGKRIGIGAKNESKTDSQTLKKARISAVLMK